METLEKNRCFRGFESKAGGVKGRDVTGELEGREERQKLEITARTRRGWNNPKGRRGEDEPVEESPGEGIEIFVYEVIDMFVDDDGDGGR